MKSGSHQRGAVTLYVALLSTFVLSGLMVMSVDVGRFYLIQGELQTAADAAALAAATQLVGTVNAQAHATDQVTAAFDTSDNSDNRFNLHLNQFGTSGANTNLTTTMAFDFFSTRLDALANQNGGKTGADAKYVRVQVTAQTPVLFTRLIDPTFGPPGPTVAAAAVAGISSPICTACGIDDLAVVDQSSGSDPLNYGFVPGNFYTLYLDVSEQTAPTGPTCTSSPPTTALTGTDSAVNYVALDHLPTGGAIDPDGTLYELAAAGMEQTDNDTIGPGQPPSGGLATVGGPQGTIGPEATFGTFTSLVPTTAAPGQDVICGLNARFGVDPSQAPPCDTAASGKFLGLAPAFSPDTDDGSGTYSNGVGLEDYSSEYTGNLRRVLTVPVVDDPSTLNVLGFRQFLVETDSSAPAGAGLNPSTTGSTCQSGAFPAQYIGWPAPIHCGGVGGSCTVSFGVGRVVLH